MDDETPEAAYRILHARVTGSPPSAGDRAISAAQYDAARTAYLAERHITARPGVALWPPTSQTVMKRLGGGSWAAAMASLELVANTGRARGAGTFGDDDYRRAIVEFLTAAADDDDPSVTSTSFAAYSAWAKGRQAAGARHPSGAAVRQHFGGWDAAKSSVG